MTNDLNRALATLIARRNELLALTHRADQAASECRERGEEMPREVLCGFAYHTELRLIERRMHQLREQGAK